MLIEIKSIRKSEKDGIDEVVLEVDNDGLETLFKLQQKEKGTEKEPSQKECK